MNKNSGERIFDNTSWNIRSQFDLVNVNGKIYNFMKCKECKALVPMENLDKHISIHEKKYGID